MNLKDTATKVLVALAYVDELGYNKKAGLVNAVGDPSVLGGKKDVVRKFLGEEKAEAFFKNLDGIDKILDELERRDIKWLSFLDDDYPDRLREIEDRPLVLFVNGNASALKSDCIAVVGSRRTTRYGEKVADDFTREFARAGLTVVSGFARGIDSVAHKACVANASPTVAVFASGLDVIYPAENKGLMDGILINGGAIVSEYPLGTKPLQYHFPERNRIISGLSRAVFLAQAAKRSGSLITMRLAIEQGKDVFAVPGNIYAAECEGANDLLREIPDALVLCADDVLDAMRVKRTSYEKPVVEINLVESQILETLRDGEKHFEELLEATELSVNELTNELFNLELNGLIQNTGGNYYTLAGV